MKIAIAGGTGVVGARVVEAAAAAGHEPVVLSRSRGVDLISGAGVTAAVDGAEAVIDVANVVALSRGKAVAFFGTETRNLLAASASAGVRHHVALSIVGIDRVRLGYYAGKLAQERLIAAGPVPWSVVRATQFHEFSGQLLARMKGPVAVVPRMQSATVAAWEVAEHLVAVAVGEPLGQATELAGPEVHDMADLARRVLRARGSRRRVLSLRLPGRAGAAMANGDLLPSGDCVRGTQTFDEWLQATRVS